MVNFTEEKTVVSGAALKSNYPEVINCFRQFSQTQGLKLNDILFGRAVRGAKVGGRLVSHRTTGELVKLRDMSLVLTVKFPQLVDINKLLDMLVQLDEVVYAHQPITVSLEVEPDDPLYETDQWHLPKIDAPKVWDISKGSENLKIAIVEPYGVKVTHIDLNDKKAAEGETTWDWEYPHGTEVAGVACAETDNSTGIAGLGWNLFYLPYHSEEDEPRISQEEALASDIEQAITDGANVINCSWKTLAKDEFEKYYNKNYGIIYETVRDALEAGRVVVAAGGNHQSQLIFSDSVPYTCWPAAYDSVIGVSPTNSSDQFLMYYNYSPQGTQLIDVAAPGSNIKTTSFDTSTHDDIYTNMSGTSMSAPLVSALAGLILSVNPNLENENVEVESIITATAEKVGQYDYDENGWNDHFGYGRINAYQALLLALAYDTKPHSSLTTAYNNGRRLIRDGNNRYHLVFESGGEIFYCRSNVGGSSWETPVRLSLGNGDNKYPCITERSGSLYVVWQRQSGSSYNIHYRNYASGTWSAIQTLASNVGTSAPLPVIITSTPSHGMDLMVVYRGSDGLKYRRYTGGSWQAIATVMGLSAANG